MMAFAIAMPTFAQFDGSRNKKNRFNHSNVEQYYGVRLGYNIASISSSNAEVDMDSYGGWGLTFKTKCGKIYIMISVSYYAFSGLMPGTPEDF